MMAQNYPAAMDGLALLAVTIEQASLDRGRMELARRHCFACKKIRRRRYLSIDNSRQRPGPEHLRPWRIRSGSCLFEGIGDHQQQASGDVRRKASFGDFEQTEGQEPNPLSAEINFARWALCLPRWMTRCRARFSWHLRRSFTACWRDDLASPTTTFPLPAPHPGCLGSSGPRP